MFKKSALLIACFIFSFCMLFLPFMWAISILLIIFNSSDQTGASGLIWGIFLAFIVSLAGTKYIYKFFNTRKDDLHIWTVVIFTAIGTQLIGSFLLYNLQLYKYFSFIFTIIPIYKVYELYYRLIDSISNGLYNAVMK